MKSIELLGWSSSSICFFTFWCSSCALSGVRLICCSFVPVQAFFSLSEPLEV